MPFDLPPAQLYAQFPLLLRLEIIQQHIPFLTLLTPVPDNHATAVDDLSCISFAIKHAKPSPLPKHLSVRHLDKRDLMFRAEGDDEFLVRFFFAAFVQDAHVCLAPVESFARFAEAPGKPVVDECEFEDTCVEEGQSADCRT